MLVHRGVTNFEAFLFLNQILNDLNRIITRNIFIFIIIIILISHSLSLSAAFQEIVMNDALFYRYFWRPFQFHYYLGVVCTTTYKKKEIALSLLHHHHYGVPFFHLVCDVMSRLLITFRENTFLILKVTYTVYIFTHKWCFVFTQQCRAEGKFQKEFHLRI